MTPRIGRRYDALTRFLKETLANEKIGHKVRMAAAMRLSEIYLAHDAARDRKELATLKAATAKAAEATTLEQTEPAQQPEHADPLDAARTFLERHRNREALNEQ